MKATETQLAMLHKRVTESMLQALEKADTAEYLLEKYADIELPSDIHRFLKNAKEVNPSLLTSATKFLKDNDISCDVQSDSELAELENKLRKKSAQGNVTSIGYED